MFKYAICVGNIILTSGILLLNFDLIKIRYSTYNKQRLRKYKTLLITTLYTFLFCLIQIVNYKSILNEISLTLNYNENYFKFGPSTIDRDSSAQSLLHIFCVFSLFWFLLVNCAIDKNWQKKIKFVLYVILGNGLIISVIGITGKLVASEKVLWIYNPVYTDTMSTSFGPFVYGGNAASYLNLCLAICLILLKPKKYGFLEKRDHYGIHISFIIVLLGSLIIVESALGILLAFTVTGIYFTKLLLSENERIRTIVTIIGLILATLVAMKWIPDRIEEELKTTKFVDLNKSICLAKDILGIKYQGKKLFKDNEDKEIFFLTDNKVHRFRKHSLSLKATKDKRLMYIYHDYIRSKTTYFEVASMIPNLTSVTHILLNLEKNLCKFKTESGDIEVQLKKTGVADINEISENQYNTLQLYEGLAPVMFIAPREDPESYNYVVVSKMSIALTNIMSGRLSIYQNSLKMFLDNILFGTGIGTWQIGYKFYKKPSDVSHNWAHSDIFEFFTELGVIGFMPIFCVFVYYFYIRSPDNSNSYGLIGIRRISLPITVILVNSLADFPLQVLAINLPLIYLIAFSLGSEELHTD